MFSTKTIYFFLTFHRIQNLDSIVRPADRDLPVVNTRGDVLFNSWNGIFNGQGGFFSQAPRIYSFSGKNVLTDSSWWDFFLNFVIWKSPWNRDIKNCVLLLLQFQILPPIELILMSYNLNTKNVLPNKHKNIQTKT